MDGYIYASKVWLLQNSLGTAQEVSIKGVWKNIMNSLVSRSYASGLINIDDDLSVDSSTVGGAKKGGKK